MARVWKAPSIGSPWYSLPKPQPKPYIPNNTFYSLFKRSGKRTYTRVSEQAYSSGRIAGMVFRNQIGADPTHLSIRLCEVESFKAEGRGSHFPRVGGRDSQRIHREK